MYLGIHNEHPRGVIGGSWFGIAQHARYRHWIEACGVSGFRRIVVPLVCSDGNGGYRRGSRRISVSIEGVFFCLARHANSGCTCHRLRVWPIQPRNVFSLNRTWYRRQFLFVDVASDHNLHFRLLRLHLLMKTGLWHQ